MKVLPYPANRHDAGSHAYTKKPAYCALL